MHHGQGVGNMGVGIGLGGFAVGGPAGVGYAGAAMQGLFIQRTSQLLHLTQTAHPLQVMTLDHRHTGRAGNKQCPQRDVRHAAVGVEERVLEVRNQGIEHGFVSSDLGSLSRSCFCAPAPQH